MKAQLKSIISLFSICAVIAIALAFTNYLTDGVIKANEQKALEASLSQVLPENTGFAKIDNAEGLADTIKEIYVSAEGGYVFKCVTSGYGSGLTVLCGVGADGKIKGAVCLSSSETLGYEKTYGDSFKEVDAAGAAGVATISGATKTTAAYKGVITDSLDAFAMLSKGGATQ